MENTYYTFTQAGFLVLTLLCLGVILWGIYHTLRRMGTSRQKAFSRTGIVASVFMLWLLIVGVVSYSGYFSDFSVLPPRLLPALLLPFIVILTLTFHPAFNRFLARVPAAWLIHFQVFRVPVELLLWLLFIDRLLPVQMTFEGRNWDVLTGLTAPLVAYLCFGRGRNNKWLAIVWNLAGFALLVNIVTIAILSMPAPFRVFMNEPANTIVTVFPIVYLPTVLVPIAYALHFFSLRKLMKEPKKTPVLKNSSEARATYN